MRIPCTIMRGGTSKALFFLAADLPPDTELRTKIILRAFGSPDARQIDGLGGADPLTSKVAIIAPSTRSGVDVDYTFGQVAIKEAFVDWSGNCGNISSAVGPFALECGIAPVAEPVSRVRILNTNTNKMIIADVPVRDGRVVEAGDYRIDGVPGSGAEIRLHFADPGGVATGRLLPTSNAIDRIRLESGAEVEVTIVDAGNPTGFVAASQIGLRGDEMPEQIEGQPVSDTLEEIRAKIGERMGLTASWRELFGRYRTYPKIAFVSSPADFRTLGGMVVAAQDIDFAARVMAMGRLHKAFALTAAIPAAAASRIAGSVVNRVGGNHSNCVRIGHPSGVLELGVCGHEENGLSVIDEVTFGRTARKLMQGTVFVPGC
jgi:methylitaconate Delta-isomerase